jgi:hypothetical protein
MTSLEDDQFLRVLNKEDLRRREIFLAAVEYVGADLTDEEGIVAAFR